MDCNLTFYNRSAENDNAQVVIFQKNVTADTDEVSVAWRVIKNCGHGDFHPFVFPEEMTVSAGDSNGNFMQPLPASTGDAFSVTRDDTGHKFASSGDATNKTEVQIYNALAKGAISANIYKDGVLLATKTAVAPLQKAAFQLRPTIWIGTAAEVVQGKVMKSAVIDAVNTELSLLGIRSADIVMTGGGGDANAKPITFSLENIIWA
jgi:hypothetical protein